VRRDADGGGGDDRSEVIVDAAAGWLRLSRNWSEEDHYKPLGIRMSIERKESRGPFFRKDFPETDNTQWLAANILKKSGNGFKFEARPYELPFFEPGFTKKNNLQVAW